MKIINEVIVPAAHGGSIEAKSGEYITVTDLEGGQIADFFAYLKEDTHEYLSMAHTRFTIGNIYLSSNDTLVSNNHREMFEIVEDTCGVHDLTFAACNPGYYTDKHKMSSAEGLRSCRINALEALEPYGIEEWQIKDPLDLFQYTPGMILGVSKDAPGAYIKMKVLADCIIAVSSCPYFEMLGIKKSSAIKLTVSSESEV